MEWKKMEGKWSEGSERRAVSNFIRATLAAVVFVAAFIGTRNLLDMTLLGFSLIRPNQTRASVTEISVVTRSRPVPESTNTESLRPTRAFDEAQDSVYDGGFRAAGLQARRKHFKGIHPEC